VDVDSYQTETVANTTISATMQNFRVTTNMDQTKDPVLKQINHNAIIYSNGINGSLLLGKQGRPPPLMEGKCAV
jgi:hypothetical protein